MSPLETEYPILTAMDRKDNQRVVIIGAGPAGLTAAYELAKRGWTSVVLEAEKIPGGLAKTVEHQGFRFDLGGHRFFSKSQEIEDLWKELLGAELMERPRLSRIYYRNRFFYYPLRPFNALRNMGIFTAAACVVSYALAQLFPNRNEKTFEDWVTNRFGRRLYQIFFKTYTEKVWGIPCTEIGADWAAQRIAGLSLFQVVKNALFGQRGDGNEIKTLIDKFRYPRLGPGQMWETCQMRVEECGGKVLFQHAVVEIRTTNNLVSSVVTIDQHGTLTEFPCDYCLSSMPLRELILGMQPAPPPAVCEASGSLRYRDFLTVALFINREELFEDNWIYIHSPEVRVGRIQNFKRWSPDMVPEAGLTCLGLEYFVWENDPLWNSTDEDLIRLASEELATLGLVERGDIFGGAVVRVKKAYPIYDLGYQERISVIKDYLKTLKNFYSIGRNGQHRYNNQDHSMATAILAVKNIAEGGTYDPWNVNVDAEYHEVALSERSSPIYPSGG